ncbi:hypothetical protein [Spirillospora sp. NPDC047279]|uniref:hypothetical protein n=1 Tax=Spirillospora sp. NPDC047279 TaxID=3155478 RepID=UPI0033DD214B
MAPLAIELHENILDLLEPGDLPALTDAVQAAVTPPVPAVDGARFDSVGVS